METIWISSRFSVAGSFRAAIQSLVDAFVIEQERHLASGSDATGSSSSWHIPINFATSFDPDFEDTSITNWFTAGAASLQFKVDGYTHIVDSDHQWFVFNKQGLGYYRVNYDYMNWNAILEVLVTDEFETIHVLNRAQLIDDSIAFAKDGRLGSVIPSLLLDYLIRETQYTPFAAAEQHFDELYSVYGSQNDVLNVSN